MRYHAAYFNQPQPEGYEGKYFVYDREVDASEDRFAPVMHPLYDTEFQATTAAAILNGMLAPEPKAVANVILLRGIIAAVAEHLDVEGAPNYAQRLLDAAALVWPEPGADEDISDQPPIAGANPS